MNRGATPTQLTESQEQLDEFQLKLKCLIHRVIPPTRQVTHRVNYGKTLALLVESVLGTRQVHAMLKLK